MAPKKTKTPKAQSKEQEVTPVAAEAMPIPAEVTETAENLIAIIGQSAGMVWRFLKEHGETDLAKLPKGADLPEDAVNQAIGWLAREDKIRLIKSGKVITCSLVE
jgi:hypothetical protein